MTWFFVILVFGVVVFVLALPFYSGEANVFVATSFRPKYRRRNLREQKANCLLALRELDFDFEMGKLSKEDYLQIRTQYQAKTVDVMKQLEAIEKDWKRIQSQIDQELVKKIPASASTLSCTSCHSPLKAGDRFCGSCGASQGSFCTSCGKPLQSSDRFCSGCGKPKEASAHA